MRAFNLSLLFLSCALLFQACQKEYSFEAGKQISVGNLQADGTGDCLPKTVVGAFEVSTELDATANYLEVEVNVIETGTYKIATDTVNGIYFMGSGLFTETGLQVVKIPGYGTPMLSAISNFVVSYGESSCVIAVTVLPAGGGVPAEIELDGAPNECSAFVLEGSYVTGTALNAANKVILQVNVLTAGTYNVSTTLSNGITFSAAGSFLATGPNTITLTGNGTPLVTGPTNIPITIGSSSCSFSIDVVGPAEYTIDCGSAMIDGIYESGVELDDTHFILVDVDVTTPGGYNISGVVNGMTFSSAGNFDNPGSTQVKLIASGVPSNDGNFNIPLKGGTANCSVALIVDEGPNGGGGNVSGTFKLTVEGKTYTGTITDGGTGDDTDPGKSFLSAMGTATTGEAFEFTIIDANKTFAVNETYGFTNSSGNSGESFILMNLTTSAGYVALPQLPNISLTFKTTQVSANPRSIKLTFSGSVSKVTSNVNVSNGEVSFTY